MSNEKLSFKIILKRLRIYLFLIALTLIICCLFFFDILIINTTTSLPRGIYMKVFTNYSKDKIVLFHQSDDPYFNQGLTYKYFDPNSRLLKRIKGKRGDFVSINSKGVFINNELLSKTQPMTNDSKGNHLIRKSYQNYALKANEYIAIGDTSKSFDSRYFGVVYENQFIGTYIPLLTFHEDIY